MAGLTPAGSQIGPVPVPNGFANRGCCTVEEEHGAPAAGSNGRPERCPGGLGRSGASPAMPISVEASSAFPTAPSYTGGRFPAAPSSNNGRIPAGCSARFPPAPSSTMPSQYSWMHTLNR